MLTLKIKTSFKAPWWGSIARTGFFLTATRTEFVGCEKCKGGYN